MKIAIIAILLTFGSLCHAADYRIAETADALTKLLGTDWKITTSESALVIESKFDIWLVGMMSRVSNPPPFEPSTGEDRLSREAAREHYVIRLEYGPAIERDALEKLIAERKKYSDVLAYGATGKGTWTEAVRQFRTIRVPRYRGFDYSICRIIPDRPGVQVYPVSAVAKIAAAKEFLDVVLRHHTTPYE